jgi:hypothetical protein
MCTCSMPVCPSHMELLGRVIFEAWDVGAVPVAFSGSGGAAEIVAAQRRDSLRGANARIPCARYEMHWNWINSREHA